jgi:hypothetical protein
MTIYSKDFENIKQLIEKKLYYIIITKKEKEGLKYKKIIRNDMFDLYYENYKNKISDEIKQKVLLKLFEFYCMLFPYLIDYLQEKLKREGKLEENIISPDSFAIIIKLGEWLKFKKFENELIYNKYCENIQYFLNSNQTIGKFVNKYFLYAANNFAKILNDENIDLCMKNSEIWIKVKEYIEDISISYFSCLKIYDVNIDELNNKIYIFEKLFKKEENNLLYARLILMKWMYYYNFNNLNRIDYILNVIRYKIKEEDLIQEFSKFIINIREKNEYYKDLINAYKEDKEDQDNKRIIFKSFINIFQNKVKYLFYKYKIKNNIYKIDDLNDLKNIAKEFKKEEFINFEIKVYLLIAEWYLKNYKNTKNENDKNQYNYYLNFAFYITNFYNKENIINATFQKEKYIFKNIKDANAQKIFENVKILCEEYNHEYKEEKLECYIEEINEVKN